MCDVMGYVGVMLACLESDDLDAISFSSALLHVTNMTLILAPRAAYRGRLEHAVSSMAPDNRKWFDPLGLCLFTLPNNYNQRPTMSSEEEDFDLGAVSDASESDFEEIAPKAKVRV